MSFVDSFYDLILILKQQVNVQCVGFSGEVADYNRIRHSSLPGMKENTGCSTVLSGCCVTGSN